MKGKVTALMLAFALILSSFVNVSAGQIQKASDVDKPVTGESQLLESTGAGVKNDYSISADTYIIAADAEVKSFSEDNKTDDTTKVAEVKVKIGSGDEQTLVASDATSGTISGEGGATVAFTVTPKENTEVVGLFTIYTLEGDSEVKWDVLNDKESETATKPTKGENGVVTGQFTMPAAPVIVAVVVKKVAPVESKITAVTQKDNTYTVTLGDEKPTGTVFVALYDEGGKMIAVDSKDAAATVDITFTDEAIGDEVVASAKAMWVDGSFVPVAAAVQVTVGS